MRKVLVLGVPRSATTWVGQSLGRCAATTYVHEPDGVHEPFAFHARRVDGLANHAILVPGDRAPEFERLWDGVFAGGKPAGTVRDVVSRRVFKRVSSAAKMRARSGGTMSPLLTLADWSATPRRARDGDIDCVVAKSVNASLAAEWIYERWQPQVLVVHRDHRNVLGSWLAMGMGGPAPEVFAAIVDHARARWGVDVATDDAFARAAATCVVMVLSLYDALRRHDDWLALSHEAACLDPVASLAEAARGLGLEWGETAEEFVRASNRPGDGYAIQRVAGQLPDQWKSRLTDEQVRVVDDMCARFPADLWIVPDSPRRI